MAAPPIAAAGPRIAIAGAGVSGLTLAGVLSRELPHARISVFERAARRRDEGYGLDLDEHGQEALVRAGVYHRYWEISAPRSDTYKFFPLRGAAPLACFHRPALLQWAKPGWFAARPETNRGALRDALLGAMERNGNCDVRYDCAVNVVREVPRDCGAAAALFGAGGAPLGEYDLVVDAEGVHSRLRHLRVDDPAGKHCSGRTMIHGMYRDPEATFSAELLRRMGDAGTFGVMGRGYGLVCQRYGAGPDDRRRCIFYMIPDRPEAEVLREIGVERPGSRESGIWSDEENLGKVRAWIKRDMAGHFDPVYHELIDRLDRATVRGEPTHGDTELRGDVTLPLVCIGDALRNCGLGGGGILAMHDACELADVLAAPGAFGAAGAANLAAIRAAEPEMLRRKAEFAEGRKKKGGGAFGQRDAGRDPNWTLGEMVGEAMPAAAAWKRAVARASACALAALWHALWAAAARWPAALGGRGVGSTAASPVYPTVRARLARL